jgi:hypothetical protein
MVNLTDPDGKKRFFAMKFQLICAALVFAAPYQEYERVPSYQGVRSAYKKASGNTLR